MSDQQDSYDDTKPTEPLPYLPLSRGASAPASGYSPAVQPNPPPGWYPDQRSGQTRWWDGTGWTEHFAGPAPAAQANPYGSSPSRAGTPVVVVSLKQSGIAYLLLILLGGFGAHHFYLNRTGPAIALLVMSLLGWATTLIFIGWFLVVAVWVWLIIDLFLIPNYVRQANARAYRGLA